MQIEKLLGIIKKYLSGTASAREKDAVDRWYDDADSVQSFQPRSDKSLFEIREQSYHTIIHRIANDTPVIPFYKRKNFSVAVAVLIVIVGGLYFTFYRSFNDKNVDQVKNESLLGLDVAAPKNNKAVLTLADGTKLVLDTSTNGTLTMQGNVSIVKKENGLIAYDGKASETAFNTLYVPRGSKPLKLSLADGTLVWLNVASSITFPVSFTGKERKVEITGEAYFEVAKDPAMPFVVKKSNSDAEIKVLGTHFNVNGYDDEENIKITLLEGRVKTTIENGKWTILTPGQQAQVNGNNLQITDDADIDEVTAWKDGRFHFDGADIKTIMRQVEKWYDVDIQYESEIEYSFVAKISRDVNVSQILKIFEMTNLVHFKIEGRKITIMQ